MAPIQIHDNLKNRAATQKMMSFVVVLVHTTKTHQERLNNTK